MNAQKLSWDDLEIFLATARGGGLSAAARALAINHATVSRRVARLEADLSVRLFDRGQRGYALTAAGEELLSHVESIEAEVHTIGRKVAGRDTRLEGTVRVTTVDDLAMCVMPALLAAFRKRHPAVTVALDVHTEFADLGKLQADVALRFGKPPRGGRIVRRRISAIASSFYASKDYLRRHPLPRVPADLAQHEIVRGSERMAALTMEKIVDRYADLARVAMRSNSMVARRAAIANGVGIGTLSAFVALDAPELVPLELELPDMTEHMWLVMHSEVRSNARVRAFADFAHAHLRSQRARFDPPV
jgi:DNA-binding transcriptional LysR family regulator